MKPKTQHTNFENIEFKSHFPQGHKEPTPDKSKLTWDFKKVPEGMGQ